MSKKVKKNVKEGNRTKILYYYDKRNIKYIKKKQEQYSLRKQEWLV